MNEPPLCPRCGAPLLDDAPAGLCPKCLVQAAFESEALPEPPASDSNAAVQPTLKSPGSKAGFEPPLPEELVPLFPHLEILELLGKGGMGAVYKARHRGLDRLVAVKILPPEIGQDASFSERFTREARALARLSHNHIVSVYDFGCVNDLFYIMMEYVDGTNLRQAIQAGGLTSQAALAIVPQICEALQFAHDEGIVHRDIKPENILIDKRGRVKIADFGLAKLLGQDASDHSLTATHQVMGTLRYMAPEQLQGSREVDHRADIYSLGVVFYELLTGELPMGRFAPPSKKVQVDVRLDEIVLRALEQEPQQRYQHASEIKTDVESVTSKLVATLSPEPASKQSVRAKDSLVSSFSSNRQLLVEPTESSPVTRVESDAENVASKLRRDAPSLSAEPRLSRLALCGAIWAPAFFMTVLFFMSFFANVPQEIGILLRSNLLRYTLLPLGTLAPFGTTILGAVAIIQIKQSRGKLYGLELATIDAIFFPLFVLFLLVTVIFSYILMAITSSHLQQENEVPFLAASALAALVICFFVGRTAWGAIMPSNKGKLQAEDIVDHGESWITVCLVATCVTGLAGCLWPYSVMDHSFLGLITHGERMPLPGVVVDPDPNALGEIGEHTPASKAGVIKGDTILTMNRKEVHIWGPDNPDRIWKATPIGTQMEITVLRNQSKIILKTFRSPDPVAVCFYANWQFIAGFCFFFFAVFAVLIPPSADLARWRGSVAASLGLLLLMILVFGSTNWMNEPAKELWNMYRFRHDDSPTTYGQKLSACIAALALMLLGLYDIRRELMRRALDQEPK